jgi:hypothetical protein
MSHGYSSGRSHSSDCSGAYYYLVNHVNGNTVLVRCCLVLKLDQTLTSLRHENERVTPWGALSLRPSLVAIPYTHFFLYVQCKIFKAWKSFKRGRKKKLMCRIQGLVDRSDVSPIPPLG